MLKENKIFAASERSEREATLILTGFLFSQWPIEVRARYYGTLN